MPSQRVHIECPAKVNLALSVAAPLAEPDDPSRSGMHPLASWMVTVHFADGLDLDTCEPEQAGLQISYSRDAPRPGRVDWPIEKDLAYRAWKLLETDTARPLPVRASLQKWIPTGAGLGGGSSDAAAMLVGLDRLFGLRLGYERLTSLAAKLGSDVAFLVGALMGDHSALVTGLGERVEPLPRTAPLYLVLVMPEFDCPTGRVYAAFDQLGSAPAQPDEQRVRQAAAMDPLRPEAPFNDLAEAACAVRPELADLRQRLTDKLQTPVHVTGSGSTLFILAPSPVLCRVLTQKVTNIAGVPAIGTRTIPSRQGA